MKKSLITTIFCVSLVATEGAAPTDVATRVDLQALRVLIVHNTHKAECLNLDTPEAYEGWKFSQSAAFFDV